MDQGNYTEIMLNSSSMKPPCGDLDLQPLEHCSDTLATSPRKLMRNMLVQDVFN